LGSVKSGNPTTNLFVLSFWLQAKFWQGVYQYISLYYQTSWHWICMMKLVASLTDLSTHTQHPQGWYPKAQTIMGNGIMVSCKRKLVNNRAFSRDVIAAMLVSHEQNFLISVHC
jgi:hypothetical protein